MTVRVGIVNGKLNNEYLDWCKVWTEECARVLKPNRMMVIWGTLKTDTFLRHKLEILNKIPELSWIFSE